MQSDVKQVIPFTVESLSEGGIVTCAAENAKGLTKATAKVIFSNFAKDDISFGSARHYYKGGFSDSLTCSAKAFKYQQNSLEWFLDGKKIEKSKGLCFNDSQTEIIV